MHQQDLNEGKIIIYSDGGSKNNPGIGGYGAVMLFKTKDKIHRKELSEGFRKTTNNRMELLGCIVALEAIKKNVKTVIYSDSKYIVDAINKGWLKNWINRGWKRGKNEEVKNVDLWQRMQKSLQNKNVEFKWVKGHSGVVENERCDELANLAMQNANQIDEVYESLN